MEGVKELVFKAEDINKVSIMLNSLEIKGIENLKRILLIDSILQNGRLLEENLESKEV